MKHGLIRFLLLAAVVAAAQSCEFGYPFYGEPKLEHFESGRLGSGAGRGGGSETGQSNRTDEPNSSSPGTQTNKSPSEPCVLAYNSKGLAKITVYIGRRWNSNAYWPRTDGDYKKGSIIQFPASGGTLDIDIVNEYATFSLYITGYNKNVVADRYSFVEDGYYAGVMSFSQYGTQYGRIPYRLVVKPNTTGKVIYPFCDAHWTSIRDYDYLGEFHICCRQLAGSSGESTQIELIDIE